jgi:hypothetical protein
VRVTLLVVVALAAVGCRHVHDVALELRTATEASDLLATDDPARDVLPDLDCGAGYPSALAAVCVQVYTLHEGTITMEATCHDAPAVASDSDLEAFLRGLSPVAAGIATGSGTSIFVRLLGYDDATRAVGSLVMCGITPSYPGHADESSSPPTLALYLLCHDPAGAPSVAGTIFDDYCGSSDFVALFP